MGMSIGAIKAIAKKHQYNGILQISYDEGCSNFFIEPKDVLKEGAFVVMDGKELLMVPGAMKNKKTGMRDIECTTYRTIEDIRAVVCINDPTKKELIDYADQYAY